MPSATNYRIRCIAKSYFQEREIDENL